MKRLDEWAENGRRVSVWLIHGPGGIGKTRLALEFIRRQNDKGWDAGFVKKDAADIS